MLLAVLLAPRPAPAVDGPYYVSTTDVNLRSEPNGDVLVTLDLGDKVFVIERDGNWALVKVPRLDKKGWVYRKYLAEKRPEGSGDAPSPAEGRPAPRARGNATEVTPGGECVAPNTSDTPGASGTPIATQSQGSKAVAMKHPANVTTPAELGGGYRPLGGAGIALIGATNVNLRAKPSLTSNVIGQVDKGDKLYIVSVDDPWYLVSVPARGLKGWVFGEYVNELPRVEIKGDQVRLRESPKLSARIKSELSKGDVFFKFSQKSGWVLVASSASGLNGWVKAEYVKKTDKAASRPYKVTGDQVNFRASPAVDAEIIAALPQDTQVKVLGRNAKWSYIEYAGQQGWLYSDYLDPQFKHAPREVYGKSIGARLIARAKAMEGTPYVWGGESDNGVDCSGLIYKLLIDEGASAVGLPRRASTQMAGLGQSVDKEDLEPGDLVFFTTYKPGPSHVGIYLGDGNFIHASSAKHQVAISNLSEGYYKQRFVGARRITEDELKRLK